MEVRLKGSTLPAWPEVATPLAYRLGLHPEQKGQKEISVQPRHDCLATQTVVTSCVVV